MMVNECGHPLCKNCVDNLFNRGAAPCPTCEKSLRKNAFWEQTLDDPMMERENFIRAKVRKIYNLHEEDYNNAREFNDYLERIETIVNNLIDGVDVEATEAEMNRFKDKYYEKIERNRRRLNADHKWIEEQLRDEDQRHKRIAGAHQKDKDAEVARMEQKRRQDQIIDQLKDAKVHAEIILDQFRKEQIEKDMAEREEEQRQKREEKREREQRRQQAFNYGAIRHTGKPYHHTVPLLHLNGPPLPTLQELQDRGYLQFIHPASERRMAGGYTADLGCMRALTEARVDLLMF
ncbi:hypothetical protein L596_010033 [Steinernema carpocapsae]|uniref:RING-type domain-containing protein n=1 Tax=Steinernema carpocapsae TaxID=34508 RepID=A0A4U5PH42_STECR|nr:hypothetical protein L596_010033 [Steinernema carpocapsae]